MKRYHLLDMIRPHASGVQNHLIDEYLSGNLSRRRFLSLASIAGLSLPAIQLLAGTPAALAAPVAAGGQSAATLIIGTDKPGQQLDPLLIKDAAGKLVIGQVGEYLSWSEAGHLRPVLAESWSSNDRGDVWTFRIRKGVTFNNGQPLTARDVAWTFSRLADPANPSSASGMFAGVLPPEGVKAVDDHTVEFHLSKPVGSFSWLVSSDNYNAYILPADYHGVWDKDWIGTGPWLMEKYEPGYRVTFAPNKNYWGGAPKAAALAIMMYEDESALVLAFLNKSIDITRAVGLNTARILLKNKGNYNVNIRHSSAHAPMHFKVTSPTFSDKRVRQAIAMCLDRDRLVKNILQGYGTIANEIPVAPVHEVYEMDMPQRPFDIEKARALLAQAGLQKGFDFKLTVLDYQYLPLMAQMLQSSLKQINVNMQLEMLNSQAYRGDMRPGSSPMLDAVSGVNSYGHRGVPNLFFNIQLKSDGAINSADFKNKTFDMLADQYAAEVDVQSQKKIVHNIHEILLDETPMIYPAFTDEISFSQKNISGLQRIGSDPFIHMAVKTA